MLAESSYTRGGSLAGKPLTGLVDPVKLLALFDEGATVVLQGLQRYWPSLADLVARLELELGHPCQANAYLTPPGSQGFAVHSDSHDVFVFQTFGSKRWEVHGEAGAEELLLEPGVVAYLPTGTPHAARAQDTASLHVTLGINQLTWRSLVTKAVQQVLADVPDTHLPAGWTQAPAALAAGLGDHLGAVADALRDLVPDDLAVAEAEAFHTGRPARVGGGLRDRVALTSLTETTRLRRRPGRPVVLVDGGERLRVLTGDRALVVPAWLRPALEHVRAQEVFTPGDVARVLGGAHGDENALVLCRRLVREGLLEIG